MKRNKIIFWVATTIVFLVEAVMPFTSLVLVPEYFNVGTKPLGYPDYFAYALIICKVLGGTALMIPSLPAKLREWAYAGLSFNLLFAIFSHIVVDGNIGYIAMPAVIGGILAVSYTFNRKIRANGKNGF